MTDVMSEIMLEGLPAPTNTELEEVSNLAEKQLYLEQEIETIELNLSDVKDKLRMIQENLLPEAMLACGMEEFKMENGLKIKIKSDIHSSIRKDFVIDAMRWLDEHELGGIIKSQVDVAFARGEAVKSHQLVEYCKAAGFNVSEKESVHPSTLKATVKEQMARGVEFPDEFFSIYSSRKAEIKLK